MQKAARELKSAKADAGRSGGAAGRDRLQLAAIGMEAEFALMVDDAQVRPEDVFGDPRAFIRGPLMHRQGTSYHLPTGGVVYFDTGVIELATPVIELERGCAARAGRSLWESLRFVRGELDAWEERTGRRARLVGFSTHYNVSFETPRSELGPNRNVKKLALLLAYILPAPVMLLATNRKSTGVGVRPRGDRIEITVDFTPSPALMVATGTLITGIVRAVMRWKTFELSELAKHRIPVIDGYAPMKHTSRKGWLARWDCYPKNPFALDIDEEPWQTSRGELSLRDVAGKITRRFWHSIRRISDPFTFRLIGSVMRGRAPSLLDLDDRPPEYEDVGRLCDWNDLFPPDKLDRSRYERILIHAIAGRRLRMAGTWYTPVGMKGWSRVVFRRPDEPGESYFSIDYLLGHLDDWEREEHRSGGGRRRPRPRSRTRRK